MKKVFGLALIMLSVLAVPAFAETSIDVSVW